MEIGLSGIQFDFHYMSDNKLDNRAALVQLVYHEYDYRQNWTTQSPESLVINKS